MYICIYIYRERESVCVCVYIYIHNIPKRLRPLLEPTKTYVLVASTIPTKRSLWSVKV